MQTPKKVTTRKSQRELLNREANPEHKDHPYIGTEVGQYEVTELLGGGAMGLVFKAYQKNVGREIAIKFLSYDLRGDELSQKRLEREAKAMGQLNHPGLVSTYELGVSDFGQPYIAMEYVKGEPLSDILNKEERIEAKRAVHFFIQIADAMDYAHQNGVIHRDLKPPNIMVTQEPWPDFLKIFDFGIARVTADSQMLTCPGEVLGSPIYMSPEQCKGEEIDCRSDIYTLGVIMYYSITGCFPIIGENGRVTMLLKTREKPEPISMLAPELKIQPALESLILKMLSVEPSQRPQSMRAVKDSLVTISSTESFDLTRTNIQSISSTNLNTTKKPITKDLFETRADFEPLSSGAATSAEKSTSDHLLNWLLFGFLSVALLLVCFKLFFEESRAIVAQPLKSIQAKKQNKTSKTVLKIVPVSNSINIPNTKARPTSIAPSAKKSTHQAEQQATKVSRKPSKTDIAQTKIHTYPFVQSYYRVPQHSPKVKSKNPMDKLSKLAPSERKKITEEIIEYMERKKYQRRNRPHRQAGKHQRSRQFQSRRYQGIRAKHFGYSPYNQLHHF